MSTFRFGVPLLLGCLALPLLISPGAAQQRIPSPFEWSDTRRASNAVQVHKAIPLPEPPKALDRSEPAYGWMVGGGLLGGALGTAAGFYAARGADDFGSIALGTALGTAAGIPVGVHLGNRGRGDTALTLVSGFGAGAAALLLAASVGGNSGGSLLLGVPLAALASAVAVEAATTR